MEWKSDLFKYFPNTISRALENIRCLSPLCEIRIRVNKRIQLVFSNRDILIEYCVRENECRLLLELLCEHSIYARTDELKNCFLTLPKGYRVGVCGDFSCENGKIRCLTSASFFNFRIARECIGSARDAVKYIQHGEKLNSTLMISSPGVGKTTLLRDTARLISTYGGKKVCIADERCEISGARNGVPCLDVGERTDVMSGSPKAEAMMSMIRTMSPDVIITDELGSKEDIKAVREASSCGVCVIASAHSGSLAELERRPGLCELLKDNVFDNVLLLHRNMDKVFTEKVI